MRVLLCVKKINWLMRLDNLAWVIPQIMHLIPRTLPGWGYKNKARLHGLNSMRIFDIPPRPFMSEDSLTLHRNLLLGSLTVSPRPFQVSQCPMATTYIVAEISVNQYLKDGVLDPNCR
jgi:hypothetical protein